MNQEAKKIQIITDEDFTLRCCWMCHHCKLDIGKGYICTSDPNKERVLGGNYEIHISRNHCPNYKRNI